MVFLNIKMKMVCNYRAKKLKPKLCHIKVSKTFFKMLHFMMKMQYAQELMISCILLDIYLTYEQLVAFRGCCPFWHI